jgi:cob(I)alamin adenosyltransferase
MAIYTKRGDKGETSVYDEGPVQGKRISKSSQIVVTLGTIDELNSFIGICVSHSEDEKLNAILEEMQKNLLTIGSIIAGSNLRFYIKNTEKLERIIDELEGSLPVLKNFVYPGGDEIASLLQFSRSLARRAEREAVTLNELGKVKSQILTYLNRLSDTLFMLARQQNFRKGVDEKVWKSK